MKLVVLLPDLRGGGAERVNIDLAKGFSKAGHEVEFVLMQARGELLEEAKASFSVIDLGAPRVRSILVPLIRYLREAKPDCILAAMWPLTTIAPIAVRLSGHKCKVMVSEHNPLSVQYHDWGKVHRSLMKASMAVGYRLADYRVGVSEGVAKDIKNLSGLRLEKFDVIHNPVSPRPESSTVAYNAAEAFWTSPSGARIVTVGSMKAQKNHPLLLRAFARLNNEDAILMFVGDGQGREALQSLAKELGVIDKVIFAGFHSDPTPFYQTADLFVLSSNYEGFGNVIVEALACGTSVVSTDCPSGPGEILEGGKYGRLVPVGDVEAMADAIEAALDEKAPSEILKARAADFHPSKAAKAYLKLMES